MTSEETTTQEDSAASGTAEHDKIERVIISGRVMVKDGDQEKPLKDVEVEIIPKGGDAMQTRSLEDGAYQIPLDKAPEVEVILNKNVKDGGGRMAHLTGVPARFSCSPGQGLELPTIFYSYESAGCVVTGRVEYSCKPLAGVTIDLLQDGAVLDSASSGKNGCFSLQTESSGFVKLHFNATTLDGAPLLPCQEYVDLYIAPEQSQAAVPTVEYEAATGLLSGVITDKSGARRVGDMELKVISPTGQCLQNIPVKHGVYTSSPLPAGQQLEVRFPSTATIYGKRWELVDPQNVSQSILIVVNQIASLQPVAYQPEPHIIEKQVLLSDNTPAAGILVDVRRKGEQLPIQSGRTDNNGLVSFDLEQEGLYEVRVYPDPQAVGEPVVEYAEVHSTTRLTTVLRGTPTPMTPPASGLGAVTGGGFGGNNALKDVVSFPVLTEEIGYPPSPLARGSGFPPTGPSGQIGQTAMKAISDVLGWQLKPDPKGFLGALNASFSVKEIEGRTEALWTPRTYAVQTDLSGGITGAQASVYSRAKDALDQSLPLLDGLYPLFKEAKDEDVAALRATVRSQFTDLVGEFGLLGGPRISRVTQLFFLLLGQQLPTSLPLPAGFSVQTDPDQLGGSLGNLRIEFGFSLADDQVNTVDDEQNLTNYRIVADYLTSLAQSWLNNLQFFGLNTTTPFFGTQLVLLSRQLSVIAESVNEVRFTMDSVFIGPAERQTLQIDFADPTLPAMFFEDLLTWIDSFSSQEGPQLIQDGGKFAVGQSFVPIATQLAKLVQGTLASGPTPPTNLGQLPPGYSTIRVQRSLQDLSDQLQQLVSLATPIQHVVTPEPEPALSVLGINPNVVSLSQSFSPTASLMIIGTGFDVGGSITISSLPAGLTFGAPLILSDNMAFVALNKPGAASTGTYNVQITVKNRSNVQTVLNTGFTVIT